MFALAKLMDWLDSQHLNPFTDYDLQSIQSADANNTLPTTLSTPEIVTKLHKLESTVPQKIVPPYLANQWAILFHALEKTDDNAVTSQPSADFTQVIQARLKEATADPITEESSQKNEAITRKSLGFALFQFTHRLSRSVTHVEFKVTDMPLEVIENVSRVLYLPDHIVSFTFIFPDGSKVIRFRRKSLDNSLQFASRFIMPNEESPKGVTIVNKNKSVLKIDLKELGGQDLRFFRSRLLARLQQEKLNTVSGARRFFEITGVKISKDSIENYIKRKPILIPSRLLPPMAQFLGVSLDEMIEILNYRFENIPPKWWHGSHYALYIDDETDIPKMEKFSTSSGQKSIGALLFEWRKRPDRLISISEMARKYNLNETVLFELEANKKPPMAGHLVKISQATGIPLKKIINAVNDTFYSTTKDSARFLGRHKIREIRENFENRSVIQILDDLFPGTAIQINPNGSDLEKILAYAKNPGSKAQFAFLIRKTCEGLPTAPELSRMLGKDEMFWDQVEKGQRGISADKLTVWINHLKTLGVSQELLDQFMSAMGVEARSANGQIIMAAKGQVSKAITNKTGLCDRTIHNFLLNKDHQPKLANLVAIKEALPDINWKKYLREKFPLLTEIFGELTQDDDTPLIIDETTLAQALELDIAQNLRTFRAQLGLNLKEMGEKLGVSDRTIFNYENRPVDMRDDRWIITLADFFAEMAPTTSHDSAEKTDKTHWRQTLYLKAKPDIVKLLPFASKNQKAIAQWHDAMTARHMPVSGRVAARTTRIMKQSRATTPLFRTLRHVIR